MSSEFIIISKCHTDKINNILKFRSIIGNWKVKEINSWKWGGKSLQLGNTLLFLHQIVMVNVYQSYYTY